MFNRHLAFISQSTLIKFGITGVLNTLVGLGIIYTLKLVFNMADTPANAIGYTVGVMFSLVVNSRWAFRSQQPLLAIAPKYLLVIAIAYVLNLLCVRLCIDWLHINSYVAQACGVVPYAGFTYLASRWWTFAPNRS